jgi:hypothetical protein
MSDGVWEFEQMLNMVGVMPSGSGIEEHRPLNTCLRLAQGVRHAQILCGKTNLRILFRV